MFTGSELNPTVFYVKKNNRIEPHSKRLTRRLQQNLNIKRCSSVVNWFSQLVISRFTWHEVDLGQGHVVLDGDRNSLQTNSVRNINILHGKYTFSLFDCVALSCSSMDSHLPQHCKVAPRREPPRKDVNGLFESFKAMSTAHGIHHISQSYGIGYTLFSFMS